MKISKIIEKRESLISEIKVNWIRIYQGNLSPQSSSFDINALYKKILMDSVELVRVKIAIQAVNMGLKKVDDLPEGSLYPTIYTLQQLKEQRVKLVGLKKLDLKKDGVISRSKIDSHIRDLDIEIQKHMDFIKEFNDSADFDLAA